MARTSNTGTFRALVPGKTEKAGGDPATAGGPQGGAEVVRRLTLLLVDDHAILREGLRALLELESDLTVVGEAGTFEVALECAARLQPDVVLSDIGLPGRSGLLLVREIRRVCPTTRVVLLTAHGTEEYIRAGLDAEADGYVLKDSGHGELLMAIRTVAAGKQYLCDAVSSLVLATYVHRGARGSARDPLNGITGRERQVLTRIACGQSNKNVARDLNLSVKTIEKHRANLMRKLSLRNAADITRFALNHHLVASEGPGSMGAEILPARTDN
ncbi:MAG TPA: response regulator transcription factor [Steroidobacteraceae bacterium]|nr:response regulator transcription factor [Steroidobacteraceae bacterium]